MDVNQRKVSVLITMNSDRVSRQQSQTIIFLTISHADRFNFIKIDSQASVS